VWNVDELETHGADGKARIGKRFRAKDTMRDDDDAIEDSAGSAPSLVLTFADSDLAPAIWKTHPSVPGAMLCGIDPRKSDDYSFISLDLEHGGNTMTRYLGSGGEIEGISTSDADPTTFLVSADDGYARLYDIRLRLPVLSLAAGFGETSCGAALLVHPDGVPSLFYPFLILAKSYFTFQ
jgi:WD40 repeat protein